MLSTYTLLVTLSLSLPAFAQNFNNGSNRRHTLAGSIIAGIIVAIAIGILLLLCIMMSVRRRRHGQTFLPGPAGRIGGGFVRPAAPSTNYNNGVYGSSPYGQYGQQQGSTTYNGPYAPQARPNTPPPPPPYTGKAEEPANGAPHADEYAPPPGPPPEAHVNGGGRYPWFKGGQ